MAEPPVLRAILAIGREMGLIQRKKRPDATPRRHTGRAVRKAAFSDR